MSDDNGQIKVKFKTTKLTDPKTAEKPPPREPVAEGVYGASIMAIAMGTTNTTPVLQKMTCEFQVLYACESNDRKYAGRRVFQDYVLEEWPNDTEGRTQRDMYSLTQLLRNAGVPFTDDGFNANLLIGKSVKITVRHRKGSKVDENGQRPVFTNVVMVDSIEDVNTEDLV